MKAFRIVYLSAVLLLAGCAGVMSFDQHLRQLEGHPVNDADLMLGHHADGQYQEGANIVYVWESQNVESVFGPSVTNGGYRVGSPSRAMHGDSFIWSGIQLDTCVIRANTFDGIIKRITYEGNPGGCETIYGHRKEPLGRNISQ